jgi:hypothetical protein
MPPPAPTLATDCWADLQAWLDTFTAGQTATLPEGEYRCQHELLISENITFVGGGAGATLQRFPQYDGIITTATATSVFANAALWTTNEHVGRYIAITSGDRRGVFRVITANTANTLTVASLGSTLPVAGDTFVIVDNTGAPGSGDDDARNDGAIRVIDTTGVTISNLRLVGYLGFFFSAIIEGQHAFNLQGCIDTTIHDCYAEGWAGDGISENEGTTNPYCDGTVSYNNEFVYIGRQGYTMTASIDTHCYDSTWNHIGRSWIDIEPPIGTSYTVVSANATTIVVELTDAEATTTSGTTTTATVTGAGWTVNQWGNREILFTSGALTGVVKDINSNTADTITWKGATASAPQAGDTFEIKEPDINSTFVDAYIKVTGEQGFSRQVLSVSGDTFTLTASDPNPPVAGNNIDVTAGGVIGSYFHDITLTDVTNSCLAAGNRKGIWCDDITLERIDCTDGPFRVTFGHRDRRPQNLTVTDCTGTGTTIGQHLIAVDGATWHRNSVTYQNRDDAKFDLDECTAIDYLTAELDSLQVDLHHANWGTTMRVVAGTYTPEKLSTVWGNLVVPNANCGVYVAAGNTLYAEEGETFTISAANMAGAPTVIQEAGATIGGHGTALVSTPLYGDVVVTDGSEPPVVTLASLTTGEDAEGGATTATDSVTPTADALVLLWLGWVAAECRTPPTVTGNGLTWTLVDHQLANIGSPASTRATALFAAQGAAPSAGAITATYDGSNPSTDAAWCVVEVQGAHVGASAVDAILDTRRLHTASNTTSLPTQSLMPQVSTNALLHFAMAGGNSQTLTTEGGSWTKINGHIGSATLFSLGAFGITDGTDTIHTTTWSSSASHTWCTIEVRDGDTSTTVRPLRFTEINGGTGDSAAAATTTIGKWSIPDLATTNGSPIVTSAQAGQAAGASLQLTYERRGFFAGLVGCTITGTNIPGSTTISSVDNAGQLTLSANATGTGTSSNTVIAGIPLTFTADRAYLLCVASRRAAAPTSPTSIAGATVTFTEVQGLTYNTDWRLSVWKYECTGTVTETLTATWAASQSGGMAWSIVEIEGADTGVVTANIVTDADAAVTSEPLTMGAYAAARNGVLYAIGGNGNSVPNAQGLVRHSMVDNELGVHVSNANVATPDATFSSDTVGAIGIEIAAAEQVASATAEPGVVTITVTVPGPTAQSASGHTYLTRMFARGGDGYPGGS